MKYTKKVTVGSFLKKGEDFKDGDILVIANEGKQVQGTFGLQNVFLVKNALGKEGNLGLNQTSINNIITAYGEDSLEWVGKKVRVWLITQSVSGKLQKVAYLAHPQAQIVEDDRGFNWVIKGRKVEPPTRGESEEIPPPEDDQDYDGIPF